MSGYTTSSGGGVYNPQFYYLTPTQMKPPTLPTPIKPPTNPIASKSSTSITGDKNFLSDLFKTVQGMDATRTTNTTTTTKQNESQAMQDMINSMYSQINKMSGQADTAFRDKFNSFEELIRSLSDKYMTTGSAASTAAANQALSSGLTPSEAGSLSQDALLSVLQEYNPALAQMDAAQSQVMVDAAAAQAALMQNLQLPFQQNVVSPYLQNVAGQVQTGRETTTDPMAKINALTQLGQLLSVQSQSEKSNEIEWARLQEAANQFQQNLGLQYSGQNIDWAQSQRDAQLREKLANLSESGAMDRTQATNLANQIQGEQRLQYTTQERLASQQFQKDQLLREYALQNLGLPTPKGYDNSKYSVNLNNLF